jgi:hypothetical protein
LKVFSLLDHRRTHRNHDLEIKSILEAAAFDADLAAQRAIAELAITEPPAVPSPIGIMKIARRVPVTMKAG